MGRRVATFTPGIALSLAACAPAPRPAVTLVAQPAAMAATVRALCGKQVAMLGEASHGDGETIAFKATLVERLIERCGFNAVFFESSHYDFLELDRRMVEGEAVTVSDLASAVGGIWNRDREFAPLVPYLFANARAGRISLGGLDDQLGSAGAFFSLDRMPNRLTAKLPDERREDCREQLRRRIYSTYPKEAPYTPQARIKLQACVRDALATTARADDHSRQMLATVSGLIDRDFVDQAAFVRGRDRAMFRNFRWLSERLPARAKIIVWSATAHVAKDAKSLPAYREGANYGSMVARRYGSRSFALGFSALSGSHRLWGSQTRPLPPAPPGSVEHEAFAAAKGNAVFVSARQLGGFGRAAARPFGHEFMTARWNKVLDGLVVFRSERPPAPLD